MTAADAARVEPRDVATSSEGPGDRAGRSRAAAVEKGVVVLLRKAAAGRR